jgi:uncharacterized membrane protein
MSAATPAALPQARLPAIDLLRGLVIAIMVLDHVRDYLHVDASRFDPLDPAHTSALLYVTRWVTHLCAPTFVFLAGTSIWLQRARGRGTRELSWFLLTRGLWLIALEFTVISFAWAFTVPCLIFLQVIWAIGCSMALLAALVWLPRGALLGLGVLIIAGHHLFEQVRPSDSLAVLWTALMVPGPLPPHGYVLAFVPYPVVPWLGVMLFGYGLGPWFLLPEGERRRRFVALGAGMLALFLLLRAFNLYGTPQPWSVQPTSLQSAMDFLRVEKYPPSLLYVCATLGLVFVLLPLIERWRGTLARVLLVFGSVPLFAYVLHLYLAHALGILERRLAGQDASGLYDVIRNAIFHPERLQGTGFSLPVVYLSWLAVLLLLYPLCLWYSRLRQRHRDWRWLSYL